MNNVVPVNNIRSFQECRLPLVLCYDILKRCSKTKCCKKYRQSSQFAVPNFLIVLLWYEKLSNTLLIHGRALGKTNLLGKCGLQRWPLFGYNKGDTPFGTQLSGFLDGTQCAKDQYAVRKNSFISYADINFYFKRSHFYQETQQTGFSKSNNFKCFAG